MPYIEFFGPPGCGKTTGALAMLRDDPALAPGRRSLCGPGSDPRVTVLGLPPEGPRMWLRLLSRLPRDVLLALRCLRETRGLRPARLMLMLLIKARALAASRHRWVVDQGLHQHLLDTVAQGRLQPERARRWRSLLTSGPWAAERLIAPRVAPDELVRRVRASEKHLAQCGDMAPEDYAMAYVRGARSLWG